jgi:hypothetical protein
MNLGRDNLMHKQLLDSTHLIKRNVLMSSWHGLVFALIGALIPIHVHLKHNKKNVGEFP